MVLPRWRGGRVGVTEGREGGCYGGKGGGNGNSIAPRDKGISWVPLMKMDRAVLAALRLHPFSITCRRIQPADPPLRGDTPSSRDCPCSPHSVSPRWRQFIFQPYSSSLEGISNAHHIRRVQDGGSSCSSHTRPYSSFERLLTRSM